ncbi:FAD binding domain-containing protein [Rhodocollybia butyracea]|uniref:FAD binding domain-containing protein n=1 Tax=Rhodocollybia butyracea TaxID=206335 RepID=A0A9P5Q3Z9_9AGAR|nr:FAD binding domain-containing protein [Rhodocollybia butyracea]
MSTNVLIVGPTDTNPSISTRLNAALLLLRNGLTVRIIEKQSQFHPGERGAGIMVRALLPLRSEAFTLSQVSNSGIIQSTRHITRYYQAKHDAARVYQMENTPARPLHNPLFLGQNIHEQVLREHIFADYGVQVELDTELRSFEQHADHVVAHIVKAADLKEENIKVDWLIGADGARSTVRKQLGLTFVGETPAEIGAVIGDIHIAGDSIKGDEVSDYPSVAFHGLIPI